MKINSKCRNMKHTHCITCGTSDHNIEERFWKKVEVSGDGLEMPWDHWIWLPSLYTGQSYGQISFEGILQKAHRVSYKLYVGNIPDGYEVDHVCGVKMCVKSGHLEAINHSENVRRSWIRRKAA